MTGQIRHRLIVIPIVLVVAGVGLLALGKYTSLVPTKDNFYLKTILVYVTIVPAVFLAWYYRSLPYFAGLSTVFVGRTLNVITGLVNGGQFPVSRYSVSGFITMGKTANYYFLANDSTPLALLGDHAILAGASVGDILILVGLVSVPLLSAVASRAGWRLR